MAKLALVAGVDVPFDVLLNGRPPEAVEESAAGGIESFVAEVVVGIADKWESLVGRDIELMSSVALSSPEPVVE